MEVKVTGKKYLFVGGSLDGQHRVVQDGINRIDIPLALYVDLADSYKRETFLAREGGMYIFILNRLSAFDAMEMLIAGYKGNNENTL